MNKYLKVFLFLILGIFLFNSCVKKHFDFDRISNDFEWDPAFAVPVAKASLSIRDIVQDYDNMELFVADEDGFLYLMYHKHIFSTVAANYIFMPDQAFPDETFIGQEFIDVGFNSSVNNATISHLTPQSFSVIGATTIDSIIIDFALLNITCVSGFQHTGNLVVTLPNIKKNGVSYTKTINITDASGSFSTSEYYNDLDGYTIDMSSGLNQIPVQCELTYTNSGSSVNAADQTIIGVNLSSIEYNRMYGDFGQDTLAFQDTIKLEVFNQAFTGHANFVDPQINVYFNNSYGMPISMAFGDLKTFTGAAVPQYQTFPFTNSTSLNPFLIGSPTQIGQSVASEINLNKNNSSVDSIINTTPEKIIFQVAAQTNPLGSSPFDNFITKDSQFDMDMEVVLPMWGNAEYFSLEDSTDLDFGELYKDFNSIEYIKMKIGVVNGMPTDVLFQLIFATDSILTQDEISGGDTIGLSGDTVMWNIDSLFTENAGAYDNIVWYGTNIIPSGILDANGKVTQQTYKETDMKFTRERFAVITKS